MVTRVWWWANPHHHPQITTCVCLISLLVVAYYQSQKLYFTKQSHTYLDKGLNIFKVLKITEVSSRNSLEPQYLGSILPLIQPPGITSTQPSTPPTLIHWIFWRCDCLKRLDVCWHEAMIEQDNHFWACASWGCWSSPPSPSLCGMGLSTWEHDLSLSRKGNWCALVDKLSSYQHTNWWWMSLNWAVQWWVIEWCTVCGKNHTLIQEDGSNRWTIFPISILEIRLMTLLWIHFSSM